MHQQQTKKLTVCLHLHGKKNSVIWSLRNLLSRFIFLWCLWVPNRGWDPWWSSLLPAPFPSQITKQEPCRATAAAATAAAAMGSVEEEHHQKCSLSRHQDGLLQPVSGCRSQAYAALMSHTSQNPEGAAVGTRQQCSTTWGTTSTSLLQSGQCLPIWLCFPSWVSWRGITNQMTQEWWSFPQTQCYHSKGQSCYSA